MPQNVSGEAVDVLEELPGEAGLADARDAGDEHESSRTALSRDVEELLDEVKLVVATNEGSFQDSRTLRTGDRGDDPGRLEEVNRLGLAFQLVLAGVDIRDRRHAGSTGHLLDVAAPRRCSRLDARRGVHPVPDDEALLGGLGRCGATGHDPDPGLKLALVRGAVGGDGRDKLDPGPHGALGVVLLRYWGTPDGHDRVADELLDDASISRHDGPGELEVARQELTYLLGVPALCERGEADKVAEQHRDVTNLGGPGDDARRRVGYLLRRGRGRTRSSDRGPAVAAEPADGPELRPAGGTDSSQ